MIGPLNDQQLDDKAEIAKLRGLLDKENKRANAAIDREETAEQAALEAQQERDKLIRWHGEDEKALAEMRATISRLRTELAATRDRVTALETYAHGCDAEGCVLPHSSWCDDAKKTAAANDGCTCGRPWGGHPQPHAMHCWTVNPPRAEVEEMRKRIAELTAAATPEASGAPVAPVQAAGAPGDRTADGRPSEGAQSAQTPRRGDEVEAWLKERRNEHGWKGSNDRRLYDALDHVLDQYRLHADTGTPLGEHVCEGRTVGDCEHLEQDAAAAVDAAGSRR
ncbi:MAG: hypothetical protein HOY75_08115 [Streptomyces sp.]|nr:hypothetical protein [Streptomyces sp.]